MGSTVRWFLFETVAGDWFVRFLERSVGIGVVVVESMEAERYAPVEQARG